MVDYGYNYTIDQFLNNKYDLSKLDREIRSSSITVAINYLTGTEEDVDIYFKNYLQVDEVTTLSGIVAVHDGIDDSIDYQSVKIMSVDEGTHMNASIYDVPTDRSGKLRVHQTSRKLGTKTYWTGCGDDLSDITDVGGGNQKFLLNHTISGSLTEAVYIDFNICLNETWIHEGLINWENCKGDSVTLEMVSRATGIVSGTNTNYNLYGGYMVIPAAGDGTIEVTSDITSPIGGLVYMPNNDLDESPTAFWNADFNSSTGLYENISPAPYGDGRYNMFAGEILFARFTNRILLLNSGFMPLSCSDTDELGNGFRLKMTGETNIDKGDHEWSVAATIVFHRARVR